MSTHKAVIGRYIEGFRRGDHAQILGGGHVRKKTGEDMKFVFSELFTFEANLVKRLETWHIWLDHS